MLQAESTHLPIHSSTLPFLCIPGVPAAGGSATSAVQPSSPGEGADTEPRWGIQENEQVSGSGDGEWRFGKPASGPAHRAVLAIAGGHAVHGGKEQIDRPSVDEAGLFE